MKQGLKKKQHLVALVNVRETIVTWTMVYILTNATSALAMMAELALEIEPKLKRATTRNVHVTSVLYQYRFGYL